MRKLVLLFVFLLLRPALSLAVSTGEQDPASSAQESSPITAWTNIDSVFASDDEYAVYTGTTQDTLYITNFTMGVTALSTIDSIWATTHALGSASQAVRRRFTGFLTKDGTTVVGESVAFQHAQTEDAATMTGGTTPLWNTTWTAAEVNASTFGIIIWKTASQAGSMSLDHATIRIAYTEPSGAAGQVIIILGEQ